MSSNHKVFFSVEDLSFDEWKSLFKRVSYFKEQSKKENIKKSSQSMSLGLIFFEPSSRTRWSFYKAGLDLGCRIHEAVVDQSTSLSKGETIEDSLELYFNLGFDLVIGRTPEVPRLKELISKYNINYINAGFGSQNHPSQAFLDLFTIKEKVEKENFKMLILGDTKHSRVARSHYRLSKILGYDLAVHSPADFGPSQEEVSTYNLQRFKTREEALDWADVVYLLRSQKERHAENLSSKTSLKNSPFSLSDLKPHQFVMHPGPFLRGECLKDEVLEDSRSLIFAQKQNGVYCRSALIEHFIGDPNGRN